MNNNKDNGEVLIESETEYTSVDDYAINKLVSDEKLIIKKSAEPDKKKYKNFISQVRLAMALIKDYRNKTYTDIPWRSIALITGAILYFVNPFDMVPDMLPVFGFGDDAMLFAAMFKSIQADLDKYREWKEANADEY